MVVQDPCLDETSPLLGLRTCDKPPAYDGQEESIADAGYDDLPSSSLGRCIITVAGLSTVAFVSSMVTGLLTVAMPEMALDLQIEEHMLLWPGSIYGLSTGCCLLVGGSLADVFGCRFIYLTGCSMITAFALGAGLSTTPAHVMICLAGQGIGVAMGLPTTIGLLHLHVAEGKRRNMGLAVIGASQPVGYAVGLFGGGVVVDAVGWRYSWFLEVAIALAALVVAVNVLLPEEHTDLDFVDAEKAPSPGNKLRDIDWIGALIACVALGGLSYVLLRVSGRAGEAVSNGNVLCSIDVLLLGITVISVPGFVSWEARRSRLGETALIPNYLWKHRAFAMICIMLFLAYAISHVLESLLSLYFQRVQHLSATQACIRFAPNALTGVMMNIISGLIAHRTETYWIALAGSCLTALSPLLMVTVTVDRSYFFSTFVALLTSSSSCDILFLISALIIASAFPAELHARASAVLNTLAQFGTAIGMAVAAVLSSTVTQSYEQDHHSNPAGSHHSEEALLAGYKANYWLCSGMAILAVVLSAWGLRGGGKKSEAETGMGVEIGAGAAEEARIRLRAECLV